jgi:hypothetical protein
MTTRWSAFVSCALFTFACSGRDIDIGNGNNGVQGRTTSGGGSPGMTTGSPGMTTGVTTGSPGMTTGVTTGNPGMSTAVTTGSSGTTTAGGGPMIPRGSPTAFVIRQGDIPDPVIAPTGGTTSTTTGGTTIDPDTPVVIIGSDASTCANPYGNHACGTWSVWIRIPRELLIPGVLSLSDTRLYAYSSSQGVDRGGGDCSFGGGSYTDGHIEILDVSASGVKVRLSDTFKFDFDADGDYDASVCP